MSNERHVLSDQLCQRRLLLSSRLHRARTHLQPQQPQLARRLLVGRLRHELLQARQRLVAQQRAGTVHVKQNRVPVQFSARFNVLLHQREDLLLAVQLAQERALEDSFVQ